MNLRQAAVVGGVACLALGGLLGALGHSWKIVLLGAIVGVGLLLSGFSSGLAGLSRPRDP